MSPSLRQQMNSSILETERKLQRLVVQPKLDQTLIDGHMRELNILKRKLETLPQDEPSIAYA